MSKASRQRSNVARKHRRKLSRRLNTLAHQRRAVRGLGLSEVASAMDEEIERIQAELRQSKTHRPLAPYEGRTSRGVVYPGALEVDTMWHDSRR